MSESSPPLDALTTVFTLPCTTSWLLTTTKVPSQIPPFPTTGPSPCDPPSWDTYLASFGFAYYSPAICPHGFSVGPSCEITDPRTSAGFPPIQSGETAVYCVPSGHTCTSDTTDFSGGVWGVSRTATANGASVTVGPAIQIRWREEDLSILETNPLTPGLAIAQPISTPFLTTTPVPVASDSGTTTSPSSLTSTAVAHASTDTPSPTSSSLDPLFPSSLTSTTTPVLMTSSADPTGPRTAAASPSAGQEASDTPSGPAQDKDTTADRGSVSGFSIAAIALTAVLIAMAQGYAGLLLWRRYRRCRTGEVPASFVPVGLGAWVRGRPRRPRRNLWISFCAEDGGGEGGEGKQVDAELGVDGPLPELDTPAPLGSKANPAELSAGTGAGSGSVNHERWSWMSKMSKRMFSVSVRARHSGGS
ncbi:hypothetical protein F5Y15DRAFT_427756 [Xylariaceae sp. FL0016]|nr:hypothetical protein F5Y15DRAFT_427756 [Xylariaceae sp. FL0016]